MATKPVKLRLYIKQSTISRRAIRGLKKMLQETKSDYELEIIDIYKKPEMVDRDKILVVPTLLKVWPLPAKRIIGDLSDRELLSVLGI